MNIRLSCLTLLIAVSLHAMEETVLDGQKMTAFWYLLGQKRARTKSNVFRHFQEFDRQDVVVTIKCYNSSESLLKKITQKYFQNGTSQRFCQTFDTYPLCGDKADGHKENKGDIIEQLNWVFELVDHGKCEEIIILLSHHKDLINQPSSAGETLLIRAINNIHSPY